MSYDIYLKDHVTDEIIHFDKGQSVLGGTFQLCGTEAYINITGNYSKHYYRILGEEGIRAIYGMTGKESLNILSKAAEKLGNDTHEDYWEPTEGNAKQALLGLIEMAKKRPDGVWQGD